MQMRLVLRVLGAVTAAAVLAACSGGSAGRTVVPPGALSPAGGAPQSAAESPQGYGERFTHTPILIPPGCTAIVTKYPTTNFPTRTAARFTGGDHFDLDATGCDYGVYLGPDVKHATIDHAKIHGAGRIQVITEGAQDVRITDTAIDDGGKIAGIEYTYNASGSVERTFVTNAQTGIEAIYGADLHVGETLVTNTSFLGVNVLENAHAVVEDVYVDNSMNVGSGVAVQLGSSGVVRRVIAIGAGQPTAFGPQFGFFFGYRDPHVEARDNTAIHNQYGFGAYCVTTIPSADELTDEHNRAAGSTIKNYDVQTANCAPPPPGT